VPKVHSLQGRGKGGGGEEGKVRGEGGGAWSACDYICFYYFIRSICICSAYVASNVSHSCVQHFLQVP